MRWRPGFSWRNIWKATNIETQDTQAQAVPENESEAGRSTEGRSRRTLRWVRRHKILSLILFFVIALLVEVSTIPFGRIAQLSRTNPGETALMRERIEEAQAAGKRLTIKQKWVPLGDLPDHLIDAVIVAEDGTFYAHGGVDWFEVKESLRKDIEERRAARGASTITQQVAKNLFLSTSKDPVRKAKELLITFLLEHSLSKDRILEIYLNVIEWGRGVFGVEAAAETYFGKHASELSLDESTRLAAVIPSPLKHNPEGDGRYVQRRQQIVLDRMAARRMIPAPVTGESISAADSTASSVSIDSTAVPAYPDTTRAREGGHNGF